MTDPITFEDFIASVKVGGLKVAAELLRDYVKDDQPESFCHGFTARALCREASDAITGEDSATYLHSKHGPFLYDFMWSDYAMPETVPS